LADGLSVLSSQHTSLLPRQLSKWVIGGLCRNHKHLTRLLQQDRARAIVLAIVADVGALNGS